MSPPAPHEHTGLPPSPWLRRWAALLAPQASVLDVACGSGRHVRWLASMGHRVTGIDRDAAALEPLHALGEMIVADIEAGPWPIGARQFEAVVVTNYLWRPRLPDILASVASGGLLIYETFARGNESVGKPSNADFLLRPGELLDAVRAGPQADWRVLGFEDGFLDAPPRFVQRIAAVREPAATAGPPRYPL
jgi:SAM-dependent methyltransferase